MTAKKLQPQVEPLFQYSVSVTPPSTMIAPAALLFVPQAILNPHPGLLNQRKRNLGGKYLLTGKLECFGISAVKNAQHKEFHYINMSLSVLCNHMKQSRAGPRRPVGKNHQEVLQKRQKCFFTMDMWPENLWQTIST